jgi:hypothetical protein
MAEAQGFGSTVSSEKLSKREVSGCRSHVDSLDFDQQSPQQPLVSGFGGHVNFVLIVSVPSSTQESPDQRPAPEGVQRCGQHLERKPFHHFAHAE